MGLFDKLFGKKEKESLDQGLQKTKDSFLSKISKAIAGKSTVDEEVLDDLEEALVTADVGIDTTVKIIDLIEKRVAKDKYLNTSDLNKILQEEIEATLVDAPTTNSYDFHTDLPTKPYVILVVGVRLGCISHALLTAEAVARDGLQLAGWVANIIDPATKEPATKNTFNAGGPLAVGTLQKRGRSRRSVARMLSVRGGVGVTR